MAQQICAPLEYGSFLAKAQQLEPITEQMGQKLMQCDRAEYRSAAVYWLSFYYVKTDNLPRLRELKKPRTSVSLEDEALYNDPSDLLARIRAGDVRYADRPEALLALARGLMRAGLYTTALQTYEKLAGLAEGRDETQVEKLYALIWAGEHEAARNTLSSLRRFELSLYLKQALQRAEILLGGPSPEEPRLGHAEGTWLELGFAQHRDNRGYASRGGKLGYRGVFELEAEALEEAHPLLEENENVAALAVSKDWHLGSRFSLVTGLGFYSPGKDNITGEMGGRIEANENFALAGGIAREAVATLEHAPPGERAGIMRDSIFWSTDIGRFMNFRAAHHREGDSDDQIFEDYRLELSQGQRDEETLDTGIGIFVPVSFRNRPVPSPDYRTFSKDFRVGLGLRVALSNSRNFSFFAEGLIESIQRSDYRDPKSFDSLLGASLKLHNRYFFSKRFFQFFEASAYFIEKSYGEEEAEKSSEFLIGIGFNQAQ